MVQYREPTLNSSPRDLPLNDPPGKKTGQGDWAEAKNLEFVTSALLIFFPRGLKIKASQPTPPPNVTLPPRNNWFNKASLRETNG